MIMLVIVVMMIISEIMMTVSVTIVIAIIEHYQYYTVVCVNHLTFSFLIPTSIV